MPKQYASATAELSQDGVYRWALTRQWGDKKPAAFVMLNPSTADANINDQTIRRCVAFAQSWGCGGLIVVNLFALRATDPAELLTHPDPVGAENDAYIVRYLTRQPLGPVVAAWGNHGVLLGRDQQVCDLLRPHQIQLQCLNVTVAGNPRHPLRLPGRTPLVDFHPALRAATAS